MNAVFPPATAPTTASHSVRVMIVEDAVVVREILRRWIDSEPDMQAVALLRDGRDAVDQIGQHDPDVVVLDIDMPRLDGLAALPMLLAKRPDLVVLMASTLTRRNAEISLKALMLGAKDCVAKPDSEGNVVTSSNFRRDLIEKIRTLGQGVHSRKNTRVASRLRQPVEKTPIAAGRIASPPLAPVQPADVMLRPFPQTMPRVLTIGASTGGPQALMSIVARLGGVFDRAPVLITQHMPPTFTAILAEHLSRVSGRPAHEAEDGEEINTETIYLAPGGRHMRAVRRDGIAVIALDDGPAVKFCKPAVDLLFSSAAQIWGPRLVSLVLTGMGSDGLRGAQDVVAAGGSVIAQDEATSVIWGMPGQVANAGLCSAVLPLMDIAPRLTRLFAGGWQ